MTRTVRAKSPGRRRRQLAGRQVERSAAGEAQLVAFFAQEPVLGADAKVADLVAGPAFTRVRRPGIDAAAFLVSGQLRLLVIAVDAPDEIPPAKSRVAR